ncbi:MAG: hypothetical protein OEW08_09375 [Gammaproteobacteria bacterium]|nr:hypothetical protein [Gammaproteobacteria bacterium]
MFKFFKKQGILDGSIEISDLPPFSGYVISLSFFPAQNTGALHLLATDSPSDAKQNEEKVADILHFDRSDGSGSLHEAFHIRRPAGQYYVQINVTLYRKHGDRMYAQVERFLFRKRPLEIVQDEEKYILLPVVWPTTAIEELEIYKTLAPNAPA